MKSDISNKIKGTLNNDITEESQLVFALSKIRKILEIEALKTKYEYLILYTNWALHSKIEDKNLIPDYLLSNKKEDWDKQVAFQLHKQFINELTAFCKDECGFDLKLKDIRKFTRLINETFIDTPLIITKSEKFTYTLIRYDKDQTYYRLEKIA